MGLAYGEVDSLISKTPSTGNMMSGSKAVTGIGTASETHQVTIHAAIPSTFQAPGASIVSSEPKTTSKKKTGPRNSPTILNSCMSLSNENNSEHSLAAK